MNMLPMTDLMGSTALLSYKTSEDDYVTGKIDEIPGPVRMLLVDTKLFAGKICEVPLDGNTLVTGTNAAGKTSIIQLLPLFKGVSPSKISNKSQGKSFYKHYLPNSTSYVAFEYRHRDGGRRTVIIHAAAADDKPMFRFVRSGLYEEMFVTEDGSFVESANLSAHLRNLGYTVADRIIDTLVDYRTIIQGLPAPGGKSKDQRFFTRMIADYTMAQARHPLMNLDRVVYSMLKKDVSLKALEEMIAEKILHDSEEIDPSKERMGLETWPARYQAYQDVMDHEDDARVLERKRVEMDNQVADRDSALSELKALRAKNIAAQSAAAAAEKDASASLKAEREDYDARKEELHFETSDALADRNRRQDVIDDIEEREKSFIDQGIETKVALADRKGDITADRDDARKRLSALEGDHSELSERYRDLEQAARSEAEANREIVRNDEDAARDAYATEEAEAKIRHAAAEERITAEHASAINAADDAKSSAQTALGEARQSAKYPQVDPEIVDKRDAARELHEQASEKISAALKEKNALSDNVRSAKILAEQKDRDLAAKTRSLANLENQLSQLEAIRKPKSGTLLAYLRNHREDWGDTIGRVINPAILHKSDLDPTEIETSTGLFGLSLDIAQLDPIDEADLTETIARIDEMKAEIAETESNIAAARKAQGAAYEALSKIQSELALHEGLLTTLEGRKTAAKNTLDARSAELDAAKTSAAEDAKARLADAEAVQKSAEEAYRACIEAREIALKNLKAANSEELAALTQIKTDALRDCNARRDVIAKTLKTRLSDLDAELKAALRSKGIDPKVMATLRATIKECEENLTSIRVSEPVVTKWTLFKDNELSTRPKLRRELEEAKQVHTKALAKEKAAKTAWQAREDILKADVAKASADHARATKIVEKIDLRLLKCDHDDILPASSMARAFDELLDALNQAEKRSKALRDEICAGVITISRAFLERPDSPAEQHLRAHMATFKSASESPEWVPALLEWFNVKHQQPRDTLMSDGRIITNSIKAGYHNLIGLDRKIKSENARLQAGLNKNNIVDVVQDLHVTISSSISKLEFLPAMKRLADLHEDWMRSGSILPPEGFTDAMSILLSFWRGKSGILDNLRDQIRIEGYLVEKGNRREFHAGTDMRDVSSNGVSYLILTTILVGFVNMVRGKAPVHIVWALDELGNIDAENTRRLLDMLADNNITLVAATPQATAAVNKLFDYRIKVIDGPQLADIRNAGRPSQRLTKSRRVALTVADTATTFEKEA